MTGARTVAIVLPHALDPLAGGVQRISWELGHALGRRGWTPLFVSLAAAGHHAPRSGTLAHPDAPLADDASAIADFLRPVFARHRPAAVINQIALSRPIADALAALRREGPGFGIVGCFRINPSMYRDNHRHIVRHQLRHRPMLLRLIDHAPGWRALLALHRWRNAPRFRQALARCDRFMLLSPTFFDELAWYVPDVDRSRLAALPNGFPTPARPPEAAAQRKRMLFVGRMDEAQKNIFLIPEIWSRIQHRLPDWELDLVGDGPDRVALEARIAARGLCRVHVHGRCDPDGPYRAARLFLMLSAYEGFGNTLVEAQARGVVPVAFDSYSAVRWILNHGQDALLVPPFDLDAYAEALVSLATDPARLAAMRTAAIANAARFSEESLCDRWDAVLADVAARGAA